MSQAQLPKLLDCWTPPPGAGIPIGCITTTFTLSTPFFEEECLARFLRMESDLDAEPSLYLIEREEKMAGVQCAAVLADYRQCQGAHSPRWDLVPLRSSGIMHAKISLICWENHVRLLVASANMTEQGYRFNQEAFAALDYSLSASGPSEVLTEVLAFLTDLMQEQTQMAPAAAERVLSLLQWTTKTTNSWHKSAQPVNSAKERVAIYPLLLAPGTPEKRNLLFRLKEIWNRHTGSPAREAFVVSPFFDSPESKNLPASQLWNLLATRGDATVNYTLTGKESDSQNEVVVHAPESLKKNAPLYRNGATVNFYKVTEHTKEGTDGVYRPLHMKSIWLENDDWALTVIGSSNFTSGGLGLGNSTQREANLVFVVNKNKEPKLYKQLSHVWPEEVKIKKQMIWAPLPSEEEVEVSEETPLDAFFGAATLEQSAAGEAQLSLTFTNSLPPANFQLFDQLENLIYSEPDWRAAGQLHQVTLAWKGSFTPSHLFVNWTGAGKRAWWPINIEDYAMLPPPEELRDLSLDMLILVLGAARPLHQVLKGSLRSKREEGGQASQDMILLDPHKQVDTSAFLLQRTRRVSAGMTALQERLRKPIYTKESLHWRLQGPVGVQALAEAICREGKTEDEKAFILAELALELSSIEPIRHERTLPPELIKDKLKAMVCVLEGMLPTGKISPDIAAYTQVAFQKAKEEV
ncbi:hypothetical protein K3G39_06785 [Pontibacter sp. HSC-14F20]|uniref:hypothetical protein n=1 Tax=Pontibacter sp. HSC-14F20 TaxID=2864136 RepID=UPI001C733357|nr:hypothetical protein [Pontibacter sp. HSC-14F20]MBX0332938.1 hypothetical protein [Pontibacter sp. HSC-14F20]